MWTERSANSSRVIGTNQTPNTVFASCCPSGVLVTKASRSNRGLGYRNHGASAEPELLLQERERQTLARQGCALDYLYDDIHAHESLASQGPSSILSAEKAKDGTPSRRVSPRLRGM